MSTNNRQQRVRDALASLQVGNRESDIFFILLNLGTATAAALAKHAQDIPRTSVYDVLKTLQHRGLVSSFIRDGDTHYRVENIEHVIDAIEAQKQELTEQQNTIRSVADIFQQLKNGTAYEPGTRYFEGKNGILAIHRELQNARKETRTIVDIASVYRTFPRMVYEDNLKDFQTFQVLKKDLMIKSKEAERYLKVAPPSSFHQVKWLPPTVLFKTDTLVWEGHVAVIDYTNRLSGIVIDNPTITETFVAWFEMIWGSIKEEAR